MRRLVTDEETRPQARRTHLHHHAPWLHGQHPQTSGYAERLAVYNSMFAPNSAVTPNIIHTNAIINVCARGKDMDALWSVAGRLPERGPGAPDKWTFTTILNALASNAQLRASQY